MEHFCTLDDKGRISVPARIRSSMKENKLVLTKGDAKGLWLFFPEEWERFSETLMSIPVSLKKSQAIRYRFIVPKVDVEIDKAGRIAVPQSLREFAGLTRDCKILEAHKHLELWDSDRYDAFLSESEENLQEVLEEMGPTTLFV
ncbi:MAG: division/cell wall cluster transcriptional repressor MraZ [Treponema sp.]|jgi:MraZ protein|nr:division/cell wall cluster transcriptional repressor MraZ [Treponema sp.]